MTNERVCAIDAGLPAAKTAEAIMADAQTDACYLEDFLCAIRLLLGSPVEEDVKEARSAVFTLTCQAEKMASKIANDLDCMNLRRAQ